jgi:hypothetical protein
MGYRTQKLLPCVLCLICGCSHVPNTPSGITEWERVSEVTGCVPFASYRGRPYDMSIMLKPELQEQLMSQLKQHHLEEPLCWYEKPNRELLLRAGPFCGSPQEAVFRRDRYKWSLVELKEMYVQCEPRARY